MAGQKKKISEKKEKQLKEAYEQTVSGSKIFKCEPFGTVKVEFPGIKESQMADFKYRVAFNEAIRQGIPTSKSMLKWLEKEGIWTKEDDQVIEDIQKEIKNFRKAIEKVGEDTDSAKPYREKISELVKRIDDLREVRNSYLQNTAEAIADEARITYLTYVCSSNAETGEKLWDSFEDFQNDRRQQAISKITYQMMLLLMGIDESLLADLPQEEAEEADLGEGENEENSDN